jgi:arylsulfatase A-like enzyme
VSGAWAATDVALVGEATARRAFWFFRTTTILIRTESIPFDEKAPGCPNASWISVRTADGAEFQEDLDCARWRGMRWGHRYQGAPDGIVRRISAWPGGVEIRLRSPRRTPRKRAPVVELAVHVDTVRYCARFRDGLKLESRRRGRSVRATPCEPVRRPNIVIVNVDDARFDGVTRMPELARLAAEGIVFENAFTPNPICTPSRASLLTGQYSLHHGTRHVSGIHGGADKFRESGADRETFAVWLQRAGYRTGLFGKYLNAYTEASEGDEGPGGLFYIPPGWDRFFGMVSAEHYGGLLGPSYRIVDESSVVTEFSNHEDDSEYSTDVTARELLAFVTDAASEDRPFMAYWAPYAPHVDSRAFLPIPAARHIGLFEDLPFWRPASWNEADVSDKPRWLQATNNDLPMLFITDAQYQRAHEALLSVDEQIGALIDELRRLGVEQDTVLIFTSDNGVSWGEHRLFGQKKGCAYEQCQRVPLVVHYPRGVRRAGSVVAGAALNIDVAPTVLGLAGLRPPVDVDGRSLESWLVGSQPDDWRDDYLIEHWRGAREALLTYSGSAVDGDRVRLFHGPTRPRPRSSTVFEFDGGDGVAADAVAVVIHPNPFTTYSNLADAVTENVPGVLATHFVPDFTVTVSDLSIDQHGTYWWIERDANEVFDPESVDTDHFGVRDVTGGYTWVEHETGENELYDLVDDPDQLENRADDPAYAEVRKRLERRLVELIDSIVE